MMKTTTNRRLRLINPSLHIKHNPTIDYGLDVLSLRQKKAP